MVIDVSGQPAMHFSALLSFLHHCGDRPTAVCMGHPAPDTDTVVSSLFEAWRRTLHGQPTAPFVQADALPTETAWLLGDAAVLVPTRRFDALCPQNHTLPLILTDHHDEPPAILARTVAVTDHHIPADGVTVPGTDVCIRRVGAATTLVVLRCREEGLIPDAAVARIALGAILLDTEGLSPAKTAAEDGDAARWLADIGTEDPQRLFLQLKERLLSETDLSVLFSRDYRAFPGLGFAVLKIRQDVPVDTAALNNLLEDDCREKEHRLCLAKVTRYGEDDTHTETYHMAGVPAAVSAVRLMLIRIGGTPLPGGEVFFAPDTPHFSRKRLVPLLQPLLNISQNELKQP